MVDVYVFNFVLSGRIYLLLVQIGRHFEFVLLKVIFGLSDVKGVIHQLDFYLEAGLLFLEIAEGKTPLSSLDINRITLLVEVVGDIVYSPDQERLSGSDSSEPMLFIEYGFPLLFQKVEYGRAIANVDKQIDERTIVVVGVAAVEVDGLADDIKEDGLFYFVKEIALARLHDVLEIVR